MYAWNRANPFLPLHGGHTRMIFMYLWYIAETWCIRLLDWTTELFFFAHVVVALIHSCPWSL